MGLKAPDYWVCPLCFACHSGLHNGDRSIIERQWEMIGKTFGLAVDDGIVK